MYYKNHAAAPGSDLSAEKIVLHLGAVLILLVLLVSMVPIARAEEINGAAGSGAMPRTASAETPSESPAPTATPSPDEELGDQLKDGFTGSVDNFTGSLDSLDGIVDEITQNGFTGFLSQIITNIIPREIWFYFLFLVVSIIILAVYRMLKE